MKLPSRRKFALWIGLSVGVLGLALFAKVAASKMWTRQLRSELGQARQAMAAGRYGLARESLEGLARRWPLDGEILFLLGQSEEARGRPERAVEAWERVPASDPYFARAAESLGHVLINTGRYGPAESFLLKALGQAPEADRYPILRTYARLLRLEGRFVEVSEALAAAWASAPEPARLLQELWQNDTEPVRVEVMKVMLDAADARDDRVWLGQAHLAMLTGRHGDARGWLVRCLGRRPDDPAVLRARLDLAVTAGNEDGFWEAAERLPAGSVLPWKIAELRAWLASRGGDRRAERRECLRLLELQPSHSKGLERLTVLALEAGERTEYERLRRRKAEVDRATDYINKLVIRGTDFRLQARELASASAVLGRKFEEQAWSLMAATSPAGLRSSPGEGVAGPSGQGPRSEQARSFCRTASSEALARLLAKPGGPRPPGTVLVADRLADLRGALVSGKGTTTRGEPGEPSESRLHFVDDAEAVGLRFVFENGRSPMWLLPEILSGGVGLVDFDGDGWLDVYCLQGGSHTAAPGPDSGDRLFRNQGDGTFRDATRQSGIERLAPGLGYGMGLAVGDYDNDGHPDLFLTRWDRYALFRNRGDGTFEDATERAGLAGVQQNPTSAAFADLDGDGDLDLYVCHYARWDPDHPPFCKDDKGNPFFCGPALYESAADRVFRNDRGRFVDVTERAGFTDPDGRGLGVVAADLDDDNRIDLYVANDGTANFLFHNKGGYRFEEIGMLAGVAANSEGGYHAGMGVVAADIEGDGRPDLLVTNLHGEGTSQFQNMGQGMFADRGSGSGILQATRYLTGFGIAAFDASNDGQLDVVIANGHVNDFRPSHPFAMPCRLYEGRPGGRLIDVSERSGPPWAVLRLGRGLAAGDLDNDGRVDLLVVSQDEPLAYFHNRTERAGHFVTFRLEGTDSNRDGVGARVVVTASGNRQVAQRVGGGSYLSACDGRLHFGLAASTSVDSIEVRWPSGRIDRWKDVAADTGYLLREGEPAVRPLAGFSRRPEAAGGNRR